MSHKTCIHCEQTLSIDNFGPSERHRDGHDSRCKSCRNAITREYRQRVKLGQVQTRRRMKKPSEVQTQPFDKELERRRHIQNLINQFGKDGAEAKIRLAAFAT